MFQRWYILRKTRLKTIDVKKATEKDLQRLGRKVNPYVSISHKEPIPYSVSTAENKEWDYSLENPIRSTATMQILRNKKTHRVVVCPGDLERIKSMFNDDWEIVESAIKE